MWQHCKYKYKMKRRKINDWPTSIWFAQRICVWQHQTHDNRRCVVVRYGQSNSSDLFPNTCVSISIYDTSAAATLCNGILSWYFGIDQKANIPHRVDVFDFLCCQHTPCIRQSSRLHIIQMDCCIVVFDFVISRKCRKSEYERSWPHKNIQRVEVDVPVGVEQNRTKSHASLTSAHTFLSPSYMFA